MRALAFFLLWSLILLFVSGDPVRAANEADEKLIRSAGLTLEAQALRQFFQRRVTEPPSRNLLDALIPSLGDPRSDKRDVAMAELIGYGPSILPLLRKAINDLESPEVSRAARQCLDHVQGPGAVALTSAMVRTLTEQKVPGAAGLLLSFLPYAEDDLVSQQVQSALASLAYVGSQPDPELMRGLKDPLAVRRVAAVEALCRADHPEIFDRVRLLMADPRPTVRARTGLALAKQNDMNAIPALINLLLEVTPEGRRDIEAVLSDIAGEWAPGLPPGGNDEISRRIRRDSWAAWWSNTEGPAVLAEFRKRTLTPQEESRLHGLIAGLGDETFSAREQSLEALVALGVPALPALRVALNTRDPEVQRRVRSCIERIDRAPRQALPAAAIRLIALRRPQGAAETLLSYIPFAETDPLQVETISALAAVAIHQGRPEPAVIAALEDPHPFRRAAATEALCRAEGGAHAALALGRLADREPLVRMRAAAALANARRREAIPVLIDLLGELSAEQTWPGLEILLSLAGDQAPPAPTEDTPSLRQRHREAWTAWWKNEGTRANLATLTATSSTLGYTLLVLVEGSGAGRIVEMGRDGKVRWQFDGPQYPVDAYVLPGGTRVLVAEYNGRKVTERDLKGAVVWEKSGLPSMVVNAQRLPNGNTFIATQNQLMEVDRTGKEVWTYVRPGNDIWAAARHPTGHITFYAGSTCIRLDSNRKEIKTFAMNAIGGWTSGIDLLPQGRVLAPLHSTNKVGEYDADGKLVWQADAPQITTATRLTNGNTLIASHQGRRAYEINREGKILWEHKDALHIFRARRR